MIKKINYYVNVNNLKVLRKFSEENAELSPKMAKLNINKKKPEVITPNVELKELDKQALNLSRQILKLENKASKQTRGVNFLKDLIKSLSITYSSLVQFLEKNQHLSKKYHFNIFKCQAKPRKLSSHQYKGMKQPEGLKAYQESKKKPLTIVDKLRNRGF